MIKQTIKSEIDFDSNCSAVEILKKLQEQFENFSEISIEKKQNEYSKFGYPFKYKVIFYHDVWVDLTKFDYKSEA